MTTALVFAAMVWQYANQAAPVERLTPEPDLAAGVPLDTSTATINVLTPPAGPALPDTVSITMLPPRPAAAPVKATPPLALLLPVVEQAYAQGGPAARRMAALGAAQAADHARAQEAYTALRNATPENGPITPAVLLLETNRLLALSAPANAGAAEAPAAATTSPTLAGWLGRQLQRFVTVRQAAPQPAADAWHAALNSAQQHIARNNPAEALLLLGQPPLADDDRLDVLRHLLAEYADLQTRLAAVREATLPLITGQPAGGAE